MLLFSSLLLIVLPYSLLNGVIKQDHLAWSTQLPIFEPAIKALAVAVAHGGVKLNACHTRSHAILKLSLESQNRLWQVESFLDQDMALHLAARLHNKLTVSIKEVVLPASLIIRAVAEHKLARALLVVQVPTAFVGVTVSAHVLTIAMTKDLTCVRWLNQVFSLLCIPDLDSLRVDRHLDYLCFLGLFLLRLSSTGLALVYGTSSIVRLQQPRTEERSLVRLRGVLGHGGIEA